LILISLLILINPTFNAYSSTTTTLLKIIPQTTTITHGETFTFNITVENVTDLCAWQIKLIFDPKLLICQNITVPPDNILGNNTTGLGKEIDNTKGYIKAFNGLWELKGVNGSGTLCQIKFQTISPGITSLYFEKIMDFSGTYLADSQNNLIEFQPIGSTIKISATNFQEFTFNINVNETSTTVQILTNSTIYNFTYNQQEQIIEFDTNQTQGTIELHSVRIPKIALKYPVAILVNGTSIPYYDFLDPENIYLNFNCKSNVHIKILSTILGDLTGDRQVLIDDVVIAAKAYGSYEGSKRWDPRADIDNNGMIDIYDVSFIARKFGSTWP